MVWYSVRGLGKPPKPRLTAGLPVCKETCPVTQIHASFTMRVRDQSCHLPSTYHAIPEEEDTLCATHTKQLHMKHSRLAPGDMTAPPAGEMVSNRDIGFALLLFAGEPCARVCYTTAAHTTTRQVLTPTCVQMVCHMWFRNNCSESSSSTSRSKWDHASCCCTCRLQ